MSLWGMQHCQPTAMSSTSGSAEVPRDMLMDSAVQSVYARTRRALSHSDTDNPQISRSSPK